MPADEKSQPHAFPSTHWSMVLRVARTDEEDRRVALDDLIRAYWRPVYYYARALLRHEGAEQAQDIVQDLFVRLLARHAFERLDPEQGSFRGFIKKALKNLVIDFQRSKGARRSPKAVYCLPFEEAIDRPRHASLDSEDVFEEEWKHTVLSAAWADLEAFLRGKGKGNRYEAFRLYCYPEESGRESVTYAEVASTLGLSEIAVRNTIARCRGFLRRILQEKVRAYTLDEEMAADELRRLTGE